VVFPIGKADATLEEVLKLYLMGAYFIGGELTIPVVIR
jgi:hypothetical protein